MTSTAAKVEATLRSLFPVEVAVAAERIGDADTAALWPAEQSAVAGAVPARVAEFAAGRAAARRVLAALDETPTSLPMGKDRAAIWPFGVSGSIAHAAGYAVAVARRGPPVGVDLEDDGSIAEDLWSVICTESELGRLPARAGREVKRIFCAKEAVFKAQVPNLRAMFGHEILDVTLAEPHFHA
ncbi:MAG: 4'-phosphopantetheinyl transferase superfamily protein, partial [Acetobacteraceae bacterium]